MSEFKTLVKQLETSKTFDRRSFLRRSLILGATVTPLGQLFINAAARGTPGEITVYGTDPAKQAEADRMMSKMEAGALAQGMFAFGALYGGLGATLVGVGLAGAPETFGTSLIIVIGGAVLTVESIGFITLATILQLIANDPPRYPYQRDETLDGSFIKLALLDEVTDADVKQSLLITNDAVLSAKDIWNRLEWYQAAVEQNDAQWQDIHAEAFWKSVETFAAHLQKLPDALEAAVRSINSQLPGNMNMFNASQRVAGQKLIDIPEARDALQKYIDFSHPLFDDGIQQQVRSEMRNLTLQPSTVSEFRALLDDMRNHANYFSSI